MRRPKTDTKSENNDKLKDANQKLRTENRELKKDVKALKRDVKRLRKSQLQTEELRIDLQGLNDEVLTEEFEPLMVDVPEYSDTPTNLTCPSCGGHDIQEISAGIFSIETCNDCGKRRKKDIQ